jgi:hypothetical protein
MTLLRTLALTASLALALAACAAPASQDPSREVQAAEQPAPPSTRAHRLRTGGPLPPQRVQDNSCAVDADCSAKQTCADTECRCVQDQCIAYREAIDPVIDPPPSTTVR